GTGIVAFEARGDDIFVCLTEEKARVRNSEIEVYEINIGGWDNTKTVIRIKSLDRYVAVVTKKDNPNAMADPTNFKKYWVACNNGLISVGCGEPGQGTVLTWQDPYPNTKVKIVGLSSWNSRVEYRNIMIASDIPALEAAPEYASAPVDSSGLSFDQIMAQFNEILAAYQADEDGTKKLTPEEADKLELKGVDLCTTGFNNRDTYDVEQLATLRDAMDKFNPDIADDDNYTLITTMSDEMTKEIDKHAAANPAAQTEVATPVEQ
ncbi:hypothetical protein FJ364_05610, partial [Candidatus Dependentiae bacterium]|nr:hypothetical protein [Candidatus Dependentiae bacterium]